MSPLEFMEKLAALVPRPRVHLTRFHGVLAPNYKYRKLIVPTPPTTTPTQEKTDHSQDDNKENGSKKKKRITWAQLLKRVLEHLKLPTRSPKIHPNRGPPHQYHKGAGNDFIQAFPDYD